MAKAQYITTTLPYVNADPHIGFALEMVQADIIARYRKLRGDDVFFNTGTDEHGQKIYEAATKAGKTSKEYVDEYAAKFKNLKEILNLSSDIHFIRTTDIHHEAAAQKMWELCKANIGSDGPDIYKKPYKGLYCVGCEAFKTEKEIVDGKCVLHPNLKLTEVSEENYFFRLSRYQDQLLGYLKDKNVIIPEWRREEAIAFINGGLEDFSISRERRDDKTPLGRITQNQWGISVPDDDSQVMYVWFDALTNYISTLGWPEDKDGDFEKYWNKGQTLQLAGKDQVRFQSIMWQAMLMSAGLATTKQVFYHGFITSGGQKMSKSVGNVIDPLAIVGEYGTDALRYYLARHVHPFEDSDFTLEKFKEAYNAGLANGLGNLAARVMQLAQTNLAEPVQVQFVPYPKEFTGALDRYEMNIALDYVWGRIQTLDQMINQTEPFKLVKTEPEKGKELIRVMVRELAFIDEMLEPIMPATSGEVIEAIMANKKPENLFPRKE